MKIRKQEEVPSGEALCGRGDGPEKIRPIKILVVGAGAMGSLYGGKLSALPVTQVILLDNRRDPVEAVNRDGLLLEEGKTAIRYEDLRAVTDPRDAGVADLVVHFVKSTATREAIRSVRSAIGPKTLALTLQNGVGNAEAMAKEMNPRHVIAGTTAHGALSLGPGHVRHTGTGVTTIGSEPPAGGGEADQDLTPAGGEEAEQDLAPARGGEQPPDLTYAGGGEQRPEEDASALLTIERIAELFNEAGLKTVISDNIEGIIWDKLLVNTGINALTAITGLSNGRLAEDPDARAIMTAAVLEGAEIAHAKGVTLTHEDPVDNCLRVARATASNKSSMLQDMEAGRPTEVEMINGAIVREAEKLGLEAPVNRTLTHLVKALTTNRG